MKKVLILVGVLATLLGNVVDAYESKVGFSIDGGGGVAFGVLNKTKDDMTGSKMFLTSLRRQAYGNLRYSITENLSIGTRIGIYAMNFDDGDDTAVFVEVPIHLMAHYDVGSVAFEGFGGYHLGAISDNGYSFGGPEVGAKIFLADFYYFGVSRVFNSHTHVRLELGFQMNALIQL